MYIRYIRGRPYLYESRRIAGKVVGRYVAPATPEIAELMKAFQQESARNAAAVRARRHEEEERARVLDKLWKDVKQQFKAAMDAGGYHNPGSRGWRKRRNSGA